MTADGLNTMVYDAESRMVSSSTGGVTTSYTYDGNGLRSTKQSSGTTTTYIYAGKRVIAEYPNGGFMKEYVYAGGELIATLQGGTPTYHLRDHLSIRVNTSSSGAVIGEQGHYPFGEQWYKTGTTSNFFFTSYQRDSESGNDNATARTHINRLSRFSSSDPVSGFPGSPQSLNRYAYTRNDPVNLRDPSGRSPCGDDVLGADPCPALIDNSGMGISRYGLDIFDAVAGTPGAYLYTDARGNWSWGFDYDLYVATWALIDGLRQQSATPARGTQITPGFVVPTSGYQTYVINYGTHTEAFGIMQDQAALSAAGVWLNPQLEAIITAHEEEKRRRIAMGMDAKLADYLMRQEIEADPAFLRLKPFVDQYISDHERFETNLGNLLGPRP